MSTTRAYVRVKRKRADASHARVVVEVDDDGEDYGEDGDDGARAARTARAAALARALDEVLAEGSRATPYGAAVTAEDAGGARKRRRRARRVAEGVARDDAERRANDDGEGGAKRVYDAMVDSLGVRRADGEAIERAAAMELALTCNYAPMVREYLASRGEANAEDVGPPPFEGEEAFARALDERERGRGRVGVRRVRDDGRGRARLGRRRFRRWVRAGDSGTRFSRRRGRRGRGERLRGLGQ